MKKSCEYGEHGSLEHLLFLLEMPFYCICTTVACMQMFVERFVFCLIEQFVCCCWKGLCNVQVLLEEVRSWLLKGLFSDNVQVLLEEVRSWLLKGLFSAISGLCFVCLIGEEFVLFFFFFVKICAVLYECLFALLLTRLLQVCKCTIPFSAVCKTSMQPKP